VGVQARGAASVSGSAAEASMALLLLQARQDGFAAAARGRRFYTTHQTPGTLVTCQTAFVATTPSFMYRINTADVRAILRSLTIGIANTPGGVVYIAVVLDTADRYSAGGNAWSPQNTNEDSANAAVVKFYDTPTASAAGAGTRVIGHALAPAVPGTMIQVNFNDAVLMGPTASSLLIYLWAGTTAPQVTFWGDHEEVV